MTIFTKIINRDLPADIVYEDDLCLAFRDINPVAPVHILVIPKKVITGLEEAKGEDHAILGHLLIKATEIARTEGLEEGGYRVVINNGEEAGQSVFHLHLHLLGGRPFSWPPG